MVAVANKQQFKIKVYKKQIEEAGDIIAFILGGWEGAGGGQQAAVQEGAGQQGRHEKEHGNFALNTL